MPFFNQSHNWEYKTDSNRGTHFLQSISMPFNLLQRKKINENKTVDVIWDFLVYKIEIK